MMGSTRDQAAQDALLACYERISRVSGLMVELAAHSDWSTLAEGEALCAKLIRQLKEAGDADSTLDAAGRRRRMEILRRILADDARIREYTQPGTARLDAFIGTRSRRTDR